MTMSRDHGGGLDAAIARWGGTRASWLDLSTGVNPVPYPLPDIAPDAWTALPDQGAMDRLEAAARRFWRVPDTAGIVAANGASALIAAMPTLVANHPSHIPTPTYNEHAAAFAANGAGANAGPDGAVHVYVHPNNPDGRLAMRPDRRALTIIDESFCDVMPQVSHIDQTTRDDVVVLKSFGKFWGLAGVRLGFLIGAPRLTEQMRERLGPWAVSGPALAIGAEALRDVAWAEATRARLAEDATRLDRLMTAKGAAIVGGTSLFRLYQVDSPTDWQTRLAEAHIWSRVFPYSGNWLRLGLPHPDRWDQIEAAL